jgi:amidase
VKTALRFSMKAVTSSMPCGFTPEGLPVGVQIVGPYRGEIDVLRLAHAFEQATHVADRRPDVVDDPMR